MVQEIINRWEENKHKLEYYFRKTRQSEYDDYGKILDKIFELVINDENEYEHKKFDIDKRTTIDDGEYQGTVIFIIPKKTYQPGVEDYIITDTYYGSCSGCDTLLSISEYNEGIPNDDQLKQYMTLALHLVQKMRWLG